MLTWVIGEGIKVIGLSTAIGVVGKQIINGAIKYFAKKNGVDVSGFDPEVEASIAEPEGPGPEDPKDPKNDPEFRDKDAKRHVFRKEENHFEKETPENTKKLFDTVKKEHYEGQDKFKNDWFARTLEDGKQVWVRTRNGKITNGGINNEPKTFDSVMGLCKPLKNERLV